MVYSYDDNWGSKLPNGTWNGIVGMVQRQVSQTPVYGGYTYSSAPT